MACNTRRWPLSMAAILMCMLTACSSVPVPSVSDLPAKTGQPRRAALLAAANKEWQFFGRQQIDMRQEPPSAPRLGLLEDEGDAVPRISLYWQSVGRSYTGADTQQPWSAAFISYLMQEAGVADNDFQRSEAHFNYLSYLKQRQQASDPLFVLRPVSTQPVTPGDLICTSRDDNTVDTIAAIHPGLPGHCDLVYELHPLLGWAGVIGGNVYNSVSESIIPLTWDGRVIPTARRHWFVVVKNLMP